MALLPSNEVESELSYAYLHAVAAQARMSCSVATRHEDNMGIDATVRAVERFDKDSILTDLTLDIQLKATLKKNFRQKDEKISYFLREISRYDKLRKKTVAIPRILVVLFLPDDSEEWLVWSEESLSMRECAWWVSLYGANPVKETKTGTTVYLPTNQPFNPKQLRDIMTRLSKEETLNYAG